MSLFSLLSPGNGTRSNAIADDGVSKNIHNLLFTLENGISIAKTHLIFLIARTPLLLFSLFFVFSKNTFIKFKLWKPSGSIVFIYWLIVISFYCFLFMPFIYQTGSISVPGRVVNLIQFYFIFCFFLGAILTSFYFLATEASISDRSLFFLFGFVFIFSFFQLSIPNKIEHAWMDLLRGKAKSYSLSVNERIRFIKLAPNHSVMVPPLTEKPSSIYITDIEADSTNWKNISFANHYGLKSIVLGDSTRIMK
jgi:hypothetical protein